MKKISRTDSRLPDMHICIYKWARQLWMASMKGQRLFPL